MKITKILFYFLVAFVLLFSFNLVTSKQCNAQDGGGTGPVQELADDELVGDGEFVADEEVPVPGNLCEECEEGGEEEADLAEAATYRPCVTIPGQVTIGCEIGGQVKCTSLWRAYGCLRFNLCRPNSICTVDPTTIACHCDFKNSRGHVIRRENGRSTEFGRLCGCP